jgi:hypothetical protein
MNPAVAQKARNGRESAFGAVHAYRSACPGELDAEAKLGE